MDDTIRICAVAHRVILGNPQKTKDYILKALSQINELSPDIIVLPSLSLCGATLGAFYANRGLLEACRATLMDIARKTTKTGAYVIIGLPIAGVDGKPVQAAAVIHAGKLEGFIPAYDTAEGLVTASVDSALKILSADSLFECGGISFGVVDCNASSIPVYASSLLERGARLIVNISAEPAHAGFISETRSQLTAYSRACGIGIVACNGNIGESCTSSVYHSYSGIFECGEELDFRIHDNSYFISTADIDPDIIISQARAHVTCMAEPVCFHTPKKHTKLMRRVRQNPYLPEDPVKAREILADYYELQVRTLAGRMRNAGIRKAVVGYSGGLDSTLAVLASYGALLKMHQPPSSLIILRMEGLSSNELEWTTADRLAKLLGADVRQISVKNSIVSRFAEIQHNPSNKNDVFSGVHERMRTQLLYDVAQTEQAMPVGTTDLSEAALGFASPGGSISTLCDINAGLTKNLVKSILEYLSDAVLENEVAECVRHVLSAPTSPLLLPLNEEGRLQRSTLLLGRYDLYDFFLYYFINYNMSAQKIYIYAKKAFEGICSPEEIKNTLYVFFKRFFDGQAGRNAVIEAPCFGMVRLTGFYSFPSDAASVCILSQTGDLEVNDTERNTKPV